MKMTVIAWEKYNRRSIILAEAFGASIHHIFIERAKIISNPVLNQLTKGIFAIYRYLVQAGRTLWHLNNEKPDVIFVQNPPVVSVFVVWLYASLFNKKFIIDTHTGAFTHWGWSLPLQRWLSKRALTTIVHNAGIAEMVKDWDVDHCTIAFTDASYPQGSDFELDKSKFNIVSINSYAAKDEPILEIFNAARQVEGINVYLTGNYKKLPDDIIAQKPANCYFTGFLSYDDYVGLLRNVDYIMSLTTRNNTMQLGGFEAVSLETPLITSDWDVLKNYFSKGSIYVDNTASGIAQGIEDARHQLDEMQTGIQVLHQELTAEWEELRKALEAKIRESISPSSPYLSEETELQTRLN